MSAHSSRPRPSVGACFWLGLALLYLGERSLSGPARLSASGLGLALLLLALGLRLIGWRRALGAQRRALGACLGVEATALLGLLPYAWLQAGLLPAPAPGNLATLGALLWPAWLLLTLLPAAALQLALASMAEAPTLELWRLWLAARAALILALSGLTFASVNFAAATWNRKIDLSYFKTTQVGEASRQLAASLTRPLRLVLFFPPGNEVLEQVRAYAEALLTSADQLSLEVLDHALAPARATALKVRRNGALLFCDLQDHCGEPLYLDLDLELARGRLRRLDTEVYGRLIRASRPPRIAYLLAGHGERTANAPAGRSGVADLMALLGTSGLEVRSLGLSEGLGTDVPSDASLVLCLGPQHELAAMEIAALQRYGARGGRFLIALDPDEGAQLAPLLVPWGLQSGLHRVASHGHSVRFDGKRQSPYNLFTTQVASHPAVVSLGQAMPRWPLVFAGVRPVGRPSATPALPGPGQQVIGLVHAMPDSWEDLTDDGQAPAAVDQGAAPSRGAGATDLALVSASSAPGRSAEAATPAERRAIVLGDVDCLSDALLRQVQGNLLLVLDLLRWLSGDEALSGSLATEEDVTLVQRREGDAVAFYGISFCLPAGVLLAGITSSRRRHRRQRP